MATLILAGNETVETLQNQAYMAGRYGDLIDTFELSAFSDADLESIHRSYDEGCEQASADKVDELEATALYESQSLAVGEILTNYTIDVIVDVAKIFVAAVEKDTAATDVARAIGRDIQHNLQYVGQSESAEHAIVVGMYNLTLDCLEKYPAQEAGEAKLAGLPSSSIADGIKILAAMLKPLGGDAYVERMHAYADALYKAYNA